MTSRRLRSCSELLILDCALGEHVLRVLRGGAAGFLVKDTPPAEIVRAIELIAEGRANAAIAAELHLSLATIKSHVSATLAALGLDNRVQIALLVQDADRA